MLIYKAETCDIINLWSRHEKFDAGNLL